jgi:hypothetical protein
MTVRSRSVSFLFLAVVTLAGTCLAGGTWAAVSAATGAAAAGAAKNTPPASGVQLPAPVSQATVTDTPNVFAGGNCSTFCDPATVYSTVVVNGEVIVGGAFGQVCTPATGATYAACPATVNADFVFAFNLSTGLIDPDFTPVLDKGPVYSLAAGPDNTVYVGGAFHAVNGQSSPGVARLQVDPGGSDDGQLVPGFSARTNGAVTALASSGNALYLAGSFGKVDGTAANVARVNGTTGVLDNSFQVTISDPPSGRRASVKTLALSPDGATLAIAGTFLEVNGQSIPRLALISTGGGLHTAATLDNWSAPILATGCMKQTSFINGVAFSPDSSYFVIVDTGYKTTGGPAVCDSAVRFETGATGDDVQPVWQNYSGADTLDSVAITGSVVYVGGHNRWFNNECGTNHACEANAVLEDGLSALDANTGLALPWWHPQTGRGIGLESLTPFPAGAFPGSDGGLLVGMGVDNIGGASHNFLAMFPETTTTAPVPGGPVMSGMFSNGRPGVDEESGPNAGVAAECMDEAGNRTTAGAPVELVTCSNDNEQNWTVNPDGTIEVNGLCLSTRHGATASGTPVVTGTCTGATSQQWQQGTGNTLINQAAGICLDDPGSSTTSGTQLQIASCTGSSGQIWPLPVAQAPPPPPPTGPLYSRLLAGDNVPCLTYTTTGQVEVSECLGTPDQSWTVEADGTIQANGQCLDTQGGSTASGTAAVLATCNGQATQVWTYKPASDALVNEGSALCLDAPSATGGTQPDIETCTARNTNQQWLLPTY